MSVEVTANGNMVFTVSYTPHVISTRIYKRSDVGNQNMYLLDEFGNRYPHVAVGGDAAVERYHITNNETFFGTFVFLPAKDGARTFTFHDGDQGADIKGLTLTEPVKPREFASLHWDSLSMGYWGNEWNLASGVGGLAIWNSVLITGCQVLEMADNSPQGKLKNTMELGEITYEIYGLYVPEQKMYLREYIAIAGPEDMDLRARPMFQVKIPETAANACVLAASDFMTGLFAENP